MINHWKHGIFQRYRTSAVLLFLSIAGVKNAGLGVDEIPKHYTPGADSVTGSGVPRGRVSTFEFTSERIFPGAKRTITLYVPEQYTGEKAACVYVGLDGLGYHLSDVFNNLIARHEMPVTIGIGLGPGMTLAAAAGPDPRYNRSFEFDSLNDRLARYIEQEIFPAIEAHRTSRGQPIRLSRDPNDHAAGGGSTGGIAAFTLGWQRPDLFRRLFISIGTFVGMRAGDSYPVLVRKTEPKPLRIFMQDGSHDQWLGGPEFGDWWMSNQTLQRALQFAGYEQKYLWGEGTHSAEHATAIFPEAMRYLWRGWPDQITSGGARTNNSFLRAILEPDENWSEVPVGLPVDEVSSGPDDEVALQTTDKARFFRISRRGELHESLAGKQPAVWQRPPDLGVGYATPNAAGDWYLTETDAGRLWLLRQNGRRQLLDSNLDHPTAVALLPDGNWLAVMESRTHFGYSYQIRPDGSVDLKEKYYWLHSSEETGYSDARNMAMDRDGRGYIATNLGVQVVDRNGRTRAILPGPGTAISRVLFGGDGFNTLYIVSSGKLYARKMRIPGFKPGAKPITLPVDSPE